MPKPDEQSADPDVGSSVSTSTAAKREGEVVIPQEAHAAIKIQQYSQHK